MADLTGGYVLHRSPLIRTRVNAHTAALDRPVAQADLDAVNAVQATPWRINGWVLDVMAAAWAAGLRLGGLEVGEPTSMLGAVPKALLGSLEAAERAALAQYGKLPDRLWDTMEEADRNDYIRQRAAIHSQNASIEGRSRAVLDAIGVAQELRVRDRIWFPHAKDFRGRIYPMATFGPHPQGSDIQKALIHFADGVELGDDGYYWLLIRAANTFGQDKLSLEDRVAWSLTNFDGMNASAKDPLRFTWWTEADEPWSFLATCFEIAQLAPLSSSLRREAISHLPVPLDGSCNGLQHLAAMGLDPTGARATNLTAAPERQDIYEEVAKRARLQNEQDVLDGIDEARVWHGRITRKVVKRAVMTTPYGVTDRGIRDQLINDDHVPDDDAVGRGKAADYLRDRIVQAIGSTVSSARAIMAWLQTTADRLGRAGEPFRWVTPTGSVIEQAYHVSARTELKTLAGRVILMNEQRDAPLNTRKQALGAPPNFIHSFDAAHLTLTVNACVQRGITSFAMIHDSYGVHAGHTTAMAVILRDQFVRIYRDDWLQKTKDYIAGYAPHVTVDDPPARGTFDVERVRDAPFFFS